jgi:hypothetical protein
MKRRRNTNLIFRLLFISFILIRYVNADDTSEIKIVKLITESKYEFHNQFGEYLEILENQIKTNYDKSGNMSSVVKYEGKNQLLSKNIFFYNNDGLLAELSRYGTDGLLVWKNIYKYGKHKQIINEASYDFDGSLNWQDKYKYNNENHLIEKSSYLDGEGEEFISHTFRYNSEKQLAKETSYYPDGKRSSDFIYTYNSDGKLIEEKFYDYNKNLTLKDKYRYDQNDNLKEWNLVDNNGNLINNYEGFAKKIYQYNREGNITDIEMFNENGTVVRKILYNYGKDGRLIESVKFFVKFMFGKIHEIPIEKSSFYYERW